MNEARDLKVTESLRILEKAKQVIPCATQTLSKGYTQFSVGAMPLFLDSAKGCRVYDVDGNEFIDYAMGLGAFILGYTDPDVNHAVKVQLEKGSTFTLPHPLEIEAAKLITEVVPSAEMVKFGKNGSDVTSAAIKAARAYTGREKIIVCGYHGWQDWYIATTERNKGVPAIMKKLIFSFAYNDIETAARIISEHKNEVAGLIMEPASVDPPKDHFLEEIRLLTKKHGIVLIFDEVFSGFRWSLGGAQEFFGVTPDISCFAKAIANGLPLSAVAGCRDIMQEFEEVFFSPTYGGEALSLAAAVATIRKLKREKVHNHIWEIGNYLKQEVNLLITKHNLEKYVEIKGYAPKTVFNFQSTAQADALEMKTYFQQECAKRGVLFVGYHLASLAHTKEDIDLTLQVYDEVMASFRKAMHNNQLRHSLRGSVVTQIFKNVGDRSSGLEVKKGG